MQYSALHTGLQAAKAPEGGRLGNTGKLLTPPLFSLQTQFAARGLNALTLARGDIPTPTTPADRSRWNRVQAYALQSVARDWLPEEKALAGCNRWRAYGAADCVPFSYSRTSKKAKVHNLQTCKRVWTCPVCARRIGERRRHELIALEAAHKAAGGSIALATFTFPHHHTDTLAEVLAKMKKAEDMFKQGAAWKRLTTRFGVIGTARGLEATYGANGWHPHIHSLVFVDHRIDATEMKDLEDALYTRWVSACERAGLPKPSRSHGVDVAGGDFAARYVSKWGAEDELTKAHIKVGKGGSFTPTDLLRIGLHAASLEARKVAKTLFQEYAAAFKGRRQLVISPGLLSRYEVAVQTDAEAADHVDDDAEHLGALTPDAWRLVLTRKGDQRGQFLEVVAAAGELGNLSPLAAFFADLTPNPLQDLLVHSYLGSLHDPS